MVKFEFKKLLAHIMWHILMHINVIITYHIFATFLQIFNCLRTQFDSNKRKYIGYRGSHVLKNTKIAIIRRVWIYFG